MIFFLFLSLSLLLPALLLTEEFHLRDGSRLRGRITGMGGDSFLVSTSAGDLRLPRSAISSIQILNGDAPAATPVIPVRDQTQPHDAPQPVPVLEMGPAPAARLESERFTHPTGRFQIGVPVAWTLDESLTRSGEEHTAAIVSPERSLLIQVTTEDFSGAFDSYLKLVEIQCRAFFADFRKLTETPIELDGCHGRSVLWEGKNPKAGNVALKSLVVVLPYPGRMVRITCLAPSAGFDAHTATFDAVLESYSSTPF